MFKLSTQVIKHVNRMMVLKIILFSILFFFQTELFQTCLLLKRSQTTYQLVANDGISPCKSGKMWENSGYEHFSLFFLQWLKGGSSDLGMKILQRY